MKITEYRYSDRYGTMNSTHVAEDTKVGPVAEARRAFVADFAEFKKRQKEFHEAEAEPARLKAEAKEAARTGASAAEAKKILKKARAAQEGLEDLEIDYAVAEAKVAASRNAYFAAVEDHEAELQAEAKAAAEAAVLTLSTGAKMTRDGSAALAAALATMNGLRAVRNGDVFVPKAPRAKKEGSDKFALNGIPEVHAQVGLESIGTAIDMAQRILRDFAAEAKARALVEGLEAEADEAPDIDDEPDEDDDDDAAEALDPDLYDVEGDDEVEA
ncbi:hypothetical protein [Microbacterium lacticum]